VHHSYYDLSVQIDPAGAPAAAMALVVLGKSEKKHLQFCVFHSLSLSLSPCSSLITSMLSLIIGAERWAAHLYRMTTPEYDGIIFLSPFSLSLSLSLSPNIYIIPLSIRY
jgi:hypothetical protein